MKFTKLLLNDAFVIEVEPLNDKRGSFSRLICQKELKSIKHTGDIVQVNHSITKEEGTVRGLHFQIKPAAEIKIVKCIKGAVFDVIVDIRKKSSTFLKWHGETLTQENMKMMYIPKGFAHGFQTLKPETELIYFHTEFYCPEYEGGLHYNDPQLSIEWPSPVLNISERDLLFPLIDKTFKGFDI